MAESVDIVPATLEDLPAISSIWPQSMKFDLMMNFIFPNHLYDPSVPEKAMYNMYARAMQQPNMQFFKAVSRARGDTVGFAGWRREDGNEARDKDYRIRPEWPDGVDAETATLYFGGLMRIEKMLMSGRKHVGESYLDPSSKEKFTNLCSGSVDQSPRFTRLSAKRDWFSPRPLWIGDFAF